MESNTVSCADTSKLSTAGRRWAIVDEVQRNYRVSVAELSQRFGVSKATVRRDLSSLEQMGLLQRVHGGAQALSLADRSFLFDARLLQIFQIRLVDPLDPSASR